MTKRRLILKSDNIIFSILIINSQMQRKVLGEEERGLTRNDSIPAIEGMNFSMSRNFSQNMDILGLLTKKSSEHPDLFAGMSNTPNFPLRQQSHGNIFTGFHNDQPIRPTPVRANLSQSYEMECIEYEKYLFDSRIKLIIKKMSIHAYNIYRGQKQGPFFVFPIQKLLTIISKKLLLNRFELLFLQYVLEETKFRFDVECIRRHHHKFNPFILLPDSQNSNPDIKLVQIYILYCAFYSKKSLNQLPADNIFSEFFKEVCPEFKERFQEWTQQSSLANKINPKLLNKLFKKLTFYSEQSHEDVENYTLVVEEIIDISPAYNADKSGKKKKTRKKRGQQHKIQQPDFARFEGKEEANHKLSEIVQHQSQFSLDPPLFKTKKSSFISNVDALEPRHYITRSMSNNFE